MHTKTSRSLSGLVLAAVLMALPASAAVFLVPPDNELVRDADAIVVARAAHGISTTIPTGQIVTDTTFEVLRVLKGGVVTGAPLVVRDLGGTVGKLSMNVSGRAQYAEGERVLLFLERQDDGWTTYGMSLGKFTYVEAVDGRDVVLRWLDEEGEVLTLARHSHHVELPRDAEAFLDYIAAVARQREPRARYFTDPSVLPVPEAKPEKLRRTSQSHAAFPPSAYTQGAFRWQLFDSGGAITYRTSGSQPGYDSAGAAQRAAAAWTNEPNSTPNISIAGTTTNGFVRDGQNTIVFNSSSNVPAGALGYAQWFSSNQHTFHGETFNTIVEGDVVIRSGLTISQTQLDEAVTHEMGHTLGFRHSDQGTPASNDAVMNSVVTGRYGASLGPWDVDALRTVYPGSTPPPPPPCAAPSIVVEPLGTTIVTGQSVTLTAAVGGTSPTIQWYFGQPGNTGQPVTGATQTALTVSPTLTTTFWARATNACGTANSNQATIAVMPALLRGIYFRADFNGDTQPDVLIRNIRTGEVGVWLMSGAVIASGAVVGNPTLQWRIVGAGDFDGNGRSDILLQNNDDGAIGIWFMNGLTMVSGAPVGTPGRNFECIGAADLNGDGRSDIILRNLTNGDIGGWLMNGTTIQQGGIFGTPGTGWTVHGAGDLNADSRQDLVIRDNANGNVGAWLMNGLQVTSGAVIGSPGLSWMPMGLADLNGDQRADVVLQSSANGDVAGWLMNGFAQTGSGIFGRPGLSWRPVNAADFNGDGRADIVTQHVGNGDVSLWLMNGLAITGTTTFGTPGSTWIVVGNR